MSILTQDGSVCISPSSCSWAQFLPCVQFLSSSLRDQMSVLTGNGQAPIVLVQMGPLSVGTPTEEGSCSCATCGSTCCDRV